jgi:predicted nucleotidyltransferase
MGSDELKPYETTEIQEKLSAIKESVLSVAPDTEAIYLFGSYAYGTPDERSDIDIYVVVPDGIQKGQRTLAGEIYCKLYSKNILVVDVLVQRQGVFTEHGENGLPSIAGTVYRKGVKIYG